MSGGGVKFGAMVVDQLDTMVVGGCATCYLVLKCSGGTHILLSQFRNQNHNYSETFRNREWLYTTHFVAV